MKERIEEKLREALPDAQVSVSESLGELTLRVRKEHLVSVCRLLRDDPDLKFDSLRDLCGVDYYRPDERYEVVYHLYSLAHRARLRLKVYVEETDARVASVSSVWQTANWLERETYDMFGIIFDGHPDLRRVFMPEEFAHYPLRKDFPLMGIPGSLSLPRK